MNYDYSKRGYLLPEGCKDLIDVWKLNAPTTGAGQQAPKTRASLPPIVGDVIGELVIPEHTTVLQLASLLSLKPFCVIADLMEFGVFANINHELDFETIAKVARKHAYTARRAA